MKKYKVRTKSGEWVEAETLKDAKRNYCIERSCKKCRLNPRAQDHPEEAPPCYLCSEEEIIKRFGDDLVVPDDEQTTEAYVRHMGHGVKLFTSTTGSAPVDVDNAEHPAHYTSGDIEISEDDARHLSAFVTRYAPELLKTAKTESETVDACEEIKRLMAIASKIDDAIESSYRTKSANEKQDGDN